MSIPVRGPRLACALALVATLLLGGCLDLGRTVDAPARFAGAIGTAMTADAPSSPLVSVSGPGRLRRLTASTLLGFARLVRPVPGGVRRGDLFLSARLPLDLDGRSAARVDVSGLVVRYIEAGASGPTEEFAGHGTVKLAATPENGSPNLQLAFALTLRSLRSTGGSAPLVLRGMLVGTGTTPVAADLGEGLWDTAFDVVVVLDDADYDVEEFAALAAENAWVTERDAASPPGFGYVDFGAGGAVTSPDDTSGGIIDDGASGGDSGGGTGAPSTNSSDTSADTGDTGWSFDDDADGGCQGDKASQDTSECGATRGPARGVGLLAVMLSLVVARVRRARRTSRGRHAPGRHGGAP